MYKKCILIDSVYINSGGGEFILNLVIKDLKKKRLINKCFFLLDSRLNLENLSVKLNSNYILLNPSENKRKIFYKKYYNFMSAVVCLANIPPPIRVLNPVKIFFHNDLFLDPLKSNLKLKNKILNFFKKKYIINRNDESYDWFVQTDLMAKNINKKLLINKEKINVTPIFLNKKNKLKKKHINSFIYVANSSDHKNHERLLKSFILSAKIIDKRIQLNLTLPKPFFLNSTYSKYDIPVNLEIVNHGTLKYKDLEKVYEKSNFLIFPSLNESFGLPLIESINNNCQVLASDLPYVYEIVRPSLVFNPFSVKSISEKIIQALSQDNLDKSRIIIENKIDTFVKHIIHNV
tara:strand:+ start:893 stop:1933 length:1041 start_codon:yes stop_codon:yes gene_type:complete